jgi:UDP-glucose 4-epimerase
MAVLSDMQREQLESLGILDMFHDCRILVTGATGFVGMHLCEALAGLGADVYALFRSAGTDSLPQKLHTHSVDLRSPKLTESCIKTIRPDVVYHLAGLVNTRQSLSLVRPTLSSNLLGSINLFMALAQINCHRLVVTGSSEEPDISRLGSSANSPYAASKDAETGYARMFHKIFSLPVVVSRPFMSYGPRQPIQKVIPYTITSLLKGYSPKINSGNRICDLIYIQDLIMGLLLTGFKPGLVGELIDLGTGIGTSIRDAVTTIVELLGSPTHPLFSPISDRAYEYPQIAEIEKTADMLGVRPSWSLKEGLRVTIAWYCNHPEYHGRRQLG